MGKGSGGGGRGGRSGGGAGGGELSSFEQMMAANQAAVAAARAAGVGERSQQAQELYQQAVANVADQLTPRGVDDTAAQRQAARQRDQQIINREVARLQNAGTSTRNTATTAPRQSTPTSGTRSPAFRAARTTYKSALSRARESGSQTAVRAAVRAQQAMQKAAGNTMSYAAAERLVLQQLSRR